MMETLVKAALPERDPKNDSPSLARFGANAAIFAASTAVDVAESKLFRTAKTAVFEGKTKRLEDNLQDAIAVRNKHNIEPISADPQNQEMQRIADEMRIKIIRDALRTHKAVESGVEFAEEWVSDEVLISHGGNVLLNSIAGNEKEKRIGYAKGLASTISDYANGIIQVFFGDRWIGFKDKDGNPKKFLGMYLAEKSMNFINPFNVEAVLRMLSEIPRVGNVVLMVKKPMDAFFDDNFIGKTMNKLASKALMGFHVMNSREKAVEQVTS